LPTPTSAASALKTRTVFFATTSTSFTPSRTESAGCPRGQAAAGGGDAREDFYSHAAGHKLNYPRILSEVNDQVFRLGRVLSPQFGIGSTLTFVHITG